MASYFQSSRDDKGLNKHPTTDIENMYSKFNAFHLFICVFCFVFFGHC